jgi:hypothetical protein
MPLSLAAFLQRRGFQHNPFATIRAEGERDRLPGWFHPSPRFAQIVGDPERPESCLVFAPTGHGKTSHRIEVARRALERPEGQALAVELTDFDVLLPPDGGCVPLDAHLAQIHRVFLSALAGQLRAAPERLQRLQGDPVAYGRFCALLAIHARDLQPWFFPPPQAEELVRFFAAGQLGAGQRLATLVSLAQAAGFRAVYILVDGVDELRETRDNPDLMARILAALLDAPGLLQLPGLAFKFFLPAPLLPALERTAIGRLDVLPQIALDWTGDELCAMLATRLQLCSQLSATSQGSTRCFADLCAADFDVDGLLAAASGGSPRAMLRLCAAILDSHLRATDDPDAPIAAATVRAVLAGPPAPARPPAPASPVPPAPPAPPAVPPLSLDDRGDLWLGERRVGAQLPRLRRAVMSCLWANRDRYVTYEELFRAMDGVKPGSRELADPHESLRKLVGHLRELIEPGRPSSPTYIEHIAGVGYVLRNVRATGPAVSEKYPPEVR